MAKRTPVVVSDEGNFIAKVEGDVIDIAISAKEGNTITQESDGLYSSKVDVDGFVKVGVGAGVSMYQTAHASNKSLAVGDGASTIPLTVGADGIDSTALGNASHANGRATTAVGASATAGYYYSVAIGAKAKATTANSVAVGAGATVDMVTNAVAIGMGSYADRAMTVSVGAPKDKGNLFRTITHARAATEDTDVPNFGQLKDLIAASSGATAYEVVELDLSGNGVGTPISLFTWWNSARQIIEEHLSNKLANKVYVQAAQHPDAGGSNQLNVYIKITPKPNGIYNVLVTGLVNAPGYVLGSVPGGALLWVESQESGDYYGDGAVLSWGYNAYFYPLDSKVFSSTGVSGTTVSINVSQKDNNSLVLQDDGLYVPAAPKLIRKAASGSISWNYTDSKGSENAAGKLGSGCYLKFPLTLYSIKTGVTDVVPNVVLTRAPCDENGVIVPHQVYVGLVTAYNNTTPKAQVTVLMESIPTHTIDTTSLSIVPVGRGDSGSGVGIPEIPIVPNDERQIGNELSYRMSVMVNSTDVA